MYGGSFNSELEPAGSVGLFGGRTESGFAGPLKLKFVHLT